MDAPTEQDLPVQRLDGTEPPPEPTPEEEWRHLVETLRTRDPVCRLGVARALSEIGSPVVPLLVAALEDATPEYQEAILSTLGLLGRKARPARSAVAKLCEDETVGAAAKDALQRIGRGWEFNRDQFLDVAVPAALVLLVVLTVAVEVGQWCEVWARLQGPGRAIALAWGVLGGVAGFFYAHNFGSRWLAWKGAQALGVAGTWVGAMLGRHAGELLAPLVTALGG